MKIFSKTRLKPNQLRTVADRRFDDAHALCQTGKNARANGAMYLGGFVIECLLKARLIETFGWLQNASFPDTRSRADHYLWSLCYRSHDLDAILAKVPEVQERLLQVDQRESNRVLQSLKSVCAHWTIFARYSPYAANITEARQFLAQIKELKRWLR